MIFIIVSLVLLTIYILLVIGYIIGWNKTIETQITDFSDHVSISIVVVARNEEENIVKCIRSIVNQSYKSSNYEIILVDDHSTDKTIEIVEDLFPSVVKIISLKDIVLNNEIKSYKKEAITQAVKVSKAELIVCTDADCIVDRDWLRAIANCYNQNQAAFIAGPLLIQHNDFFFYEMQALDVAAFTGITAATIHHQSPIVCNGANMAFSRQAFLDINGYESINHISSGDDVLLLHKFNEYYKNRIFYCKSNRAVVKTMAMTDMPSFLNQRMRWASKSSSYQNKKVTFLLALVYLFYLSIIFNLFLSLADKTYFYVALFQLVLKFFCDAIFLQAVLNFFKCSSLISIFLPAQFFHLFYVIISGLASLFMPMQWKGRKIYR